MGFICRLTNYRYSIERWLSRKHTTVGHQGKPPLYNHTDEPVDILMMGENRPYEVCYYPDSDKWLSRSMGKVGKFESTDYWTDEPDPPVIKIQE